MKNLLLTLVTFSVLLLIGCQDNSITDPIQDSGLQKNDGSNVNSGTIILEGLLNDPHPVMNSFYIINGEIQYQLALEVTEPVPSQDIVSLDLSVSANFTYLCTVCEPQSDIVSVGTVLISTNDSFYVSEEGIYMLEKTFQIQGRDDGMVLKCSFLVTTEGVGLNEMWLELNDGVPTSNDLNKNIQPDPVTYPPVVDTQIN